MDKGDSSMTNGTDNLQTQQEVTPYTFQASWEGEAKTYILSSLADVVPQLEDNQETLSRKRNILRYLLENINKVYEELEHQNRVKKLKDIIAALDVDDETFSHCVGRESYNSYSNKDIICAALPQPVYIDMNTVDKSAWNIIMNTFERLEKRLENIHKQSYVFTTCKDEYRKYFEALCYLEGKKALPLHCKLKMSDVYEILERKEREYRRANSKITADQLFDLMEKKNDGFTVYQLGKMTRNTQNHIKKLLGELEDQHKVVKNKFNKPYIFYAVSLNMLEGSEEELVNSSYDKKVMMGNIKKLLTMQEHTNSEQ
jgi:hypothetical protein